MEVKVFKDHWLRILFLVGFPMIPGTLILFYDIQSIGEVENIAKDSIVFCLFHWLTGWFCPGCGMTRSVISFFTGHFIWSFHFNPFGPFLVILLSLIWFKRAFMPEKKMEFFYYLYHRSLPYLLTVVLVWGVLRNTPVVFEFSGFSL